MRVPRHVVPGGGYKLGQWMRQSREIWRLCLCAIPEIVGVTKDGQQLKVIRCSKSNASIAIK